MSYCHATADNAKYLSSKTGLNVYVALAWLWNECQTVNNPTNPLNIRYYGTQGQTGQVGGFGTYANPQKGLDNAAWLINNSAYYGGIRAAISSGNAFAQARAIELSPWAGGHYGGANKPGNISGKLSEITGQSIPSVAQGVDNTTSSGKQLTEAAFKDALSALNISTADNYRLTADDVARLTDYLTGKGYSTTGSGIGAGAIVTLILQGLGQPNSLAPGLTEGINSAIPDIPGAIAGIGNTAVRLVTYTLAVVFILAGLWLYSKGRPAPAVEVPIGQG
jgi:hypothetical protein